MEKIDKLSDVAFPLERSDYYNFYLKEVEEIKKHQWVLGERNHGEVTFEYARWNFIIHHRQNWLIALKASGIHTY